MIRAVCNISARTFRCLQTGENVNLLDWTSVSVRETLLGKFSGGLCGYDLGEQRISEKEYYNDNFHWTEKEVTKSKLKVGIVKYKIENF